MRILLICGLAPAAAIVLAALAQLTLTSLWPGVQHFSARGVSIDSYLVVGAVATLSMLVGYRLWRSAPTRSGFLVSLLAPLAWLGLVLSTLPPFRVIALNFATTFTLAVAIAPLGGLLAGWATSASRATTPLSSN